MRERSNRRIWHVPMLLLGVASLLCGIWGGLARLPLNLPLPGGNANWITFHGPLMVCGFLGTVISLERAVGLQNWWTYAPPLLTGTGALLLLAGVLGQPPVLLITLGSIGFWIVTLRIVALQPVAFTRVMSGGALSWSIGNALWWVGWPFYRVVPWWIAFLTLTILGERLDLSRFQRPSRWSHPLLLGTLGLFLTGLALTVFHQVFGERLMGVGLLAMAVWLGRFDIARRTVKQPGLPRFMASGLLVGYFWLGVAGVLMVAFAPLTSGLRYDSVLHSVFLGFAFSMIFAHAPAIFPAVLMVPPVFARRFYVHLVLLELGLALRVISDLLGSVLCRRWGAILNGIAIAAFLLNTVSALVFRPRPAGGGQKSRPKPG